MSVMVMKVDVDALIKANVDEKEVKGAVVKVVELIHYCKIYQIPISLSLHRR